MTECDNCEHAPDDDDRLVDGLCYDCRVKETRSRRRERYNGPDAT